MIPTTCPTMDELRETLAKKIFSLFAASSNINVFPWPEQDERDKELYRKAVDEVLATLQTTHAGEGMVEARRRPALVDEPWVSPEEKAKQSAAALSPSKPAPVAEE